MGILSHIQKSNMAMFGSKLASRLFKVKHLPNSGFSGIQWVDLSLSTRNWAMSRGAVVPCNCAEKQLVTPDLHAETNWLCWWVGLRIVSFFFLEIVDTPNIEFKFVVHGCRSSEPQIKKLLLFLFRI